MSESKTYILEPLLTKSSYDEEIYSKDFFGKNVDIVVISFNRWSEFEIILNDEEKEKILKKDEIDLSNYEIEFISSDDCYKMDYEIVNQEKYDDDETAMINLMINGPDDEPYDDPINNLDEHGWTSGDVKYVITCGCQLKEVKK